MTHFRLRPALVLVTVFCSYLHHLNVWALSKRHSCCDWPERGFVIEWLSEFTPRASQSPEDGGSCVYGESHIR